MSAPEPLLEIRDLTVSYRQRNRTLRALDGVSLDVQHGETVGLVGESGSGKSTVARATLGLAPVRRGTISFAGTEISQLAFKKRRPFYRDLQIVFQDPFSSLNPARTVGSTLAEPLQAYGRVHRAMLTKQVAEMLERVHLPADAAGRYPSQFSGGQRQRIAIARALMLSPRLIVFDEPTSALDLSVQAQILNLLRELQTELGLSYLFISHDLDVVRHMCRRVVVLYQGRVLESGLTEAVVTAPAHPYTQALQDAIPLPDPRRQRARGALTRVAQKPAPVESVTRCSFAERCAYAGDRCWSEAPLPEPSEHGLVACHRFPEWRAESRTKHNGGARPTAALHARLQPSRQ